MINNIPIPDCQNGNHEWISIITVNGDDYFNCDTTIWWCKYCGYLKYIQYFNSRVIKQWSYKPMNTV